MKISTVRSLRHGVTFTSEVNVIIAITITAERIKSARDALCLFFSDVRSCSFRQESSLFRFRISDSKIK